MERWEEYGIANMLMGYENALSIMTIHLKIEVMEELLEEMDPATRLIYASRYNKRIDTDDKVKFIKSKIKELEAVMGEPSCKKKSTIAAPSSIKIISFLPTVLFSKMLYAMLTHLSSDFNNAGKIPTESHCL